MDTGSAPDGRPGMMADSRSGVVSEEHEDVEIHNQPDSAEAPEPLVVEADGLQPNGSPVDAVDRLLDEVEQALARLDDGTYGRCASCGAPIADLRLAEMPVTQTCAACASPDGA